MGSAPKTSANAINAAEKQRRALDLRKTGATYEQIADALGYAGPSSAAKAIKTAIARITREAAEDVRTLEVERLDSMLRYQWPAVTKGHVRSTEVALRIMERRAALLGLDAPKDTRFSGELGIRQYVGIDPEAV